MWNLKNKTKQNNQAHRYIKHIGGHQSWGVGVGEMAEARIKQ